MKLSKTILSGFLFSFFFFGNGFSQCDNSAIEYIAANKVKAAVLNGGDLFWNRNDGQFIVPYSPGPFQEVSTIFTQGLWLGGFDAAGNLKIAAQMYGNANGLSDYWAGPIDDATGTTLQNGCQDFDRIWKVTRGDILWVKEDFADNGMIDQPLPFSIQTWPARGNPHFAAAMGFQLPDQDLAPFFDNNNNGLYEPMNGDHPVIDPAMPNAIPDEMAWCVFNDIEEIHGQTNGLPIGVEVHLIMYAFNCSENEALNHTIFTRHKVINKSQEDLFSFKMGFFTDSDLGCYVDDAFGCDTILNTLYSYNQDNDDADPQCTGIGIYGENPPVQAITFLNRSLGNFMYFNNISINGPPSPTTDPSVPISFFNYMNSSWLDGSHLTYGGDGYDPNGVHVNHAFFDNPNNPSGWSMITEPLPFGDRRIVSATEAFDFPVGGQQVLDVAYSFHRQPGADHLENVNVALAAILGIQSFYDNGLSNECNQFQFCETDCVWPGDAGHDGIAKNDDLLYIGVSMGLNASGTERDPAAIVWSPYYADSWGTPPASFPDQKHQDCNGDGSVNELDWYVLETNYREQRPDYIFSEIEAPHAEGELYINLDKDEISANGTQFQRLVSGDIYLATQTEPFDEIYGIAFTIKYDTSVWEPFLSVVFSLENNSFFGTNDEVMTIRMESEEEGRIDVAYSRKDGQAINNAFGKLGRFRLALREDAATGNPNGMQSLSFKIFDAVGVDAAGNFFQLGAASDVVIGKDMIYDNMLTGISEELNNELQLNIFPNPNHGAFNLFFEKTNTASHIRIFDFSGKMILEKQLPTNTRQYHIDLKNKLTAGIYFIKWVLSDGNFTTKKIIVE
ncbi:MAG: T9SS type A sorting domain-containing protein [Saprospiraceae bacterium]